MGTGAVSLGAASGPTRTVTVTAKTLTIGGVISDGTDPTTPANMLAKAGAGTLALTGANLYTGGTLVSAGTLAGTTTGLHGDITNNAAVVFDQTLPASPIASGTYAGNISGPGTVTKNNAGTVILSATNDYTGNTAINGGLLAVDGSIAGSAVSVNNGGTLGGHGTTGAVTVNTGGTIAPGNSIGTIHIGDLTLSGTGALSAELNSDTLTADLVDATGNVTIADGTAVLNLTDLGHTQLPNGTKFTLVTYTGAWNNGAFAGSTFYAGLNAFTVNYQDSFGGGSAVTLTSVPEPTSLAVLGLAAGALLARRRRGATSI
jgi:autotransporter-associated beta strand protein